MIDKVDIENQSLEPLTLSRRARGPSLRQIITHVVMHRNISDAAGCLRRIFLSCASVLLLLVFVFRDQGEREADAAELHDCVLMIALAHSTSVFYFPQKSQKNRRVQYSTNEHDIAQPLNKDGGRRSVSLLFFGATIPF